MRVHRFLQFASIAVCTIAMLAVAQAQVGGEPIRIIFPFAAGGSGDALARLIADKMRASLNRPVIVENRTGAAGRIAVNAVKNAAPDGNTLLLTPIAPLAIYQHVYKSLDYDPIHDFEPLSQLATFDFGVAVGQQVPAKSLKELVAWAKGDPARTNFGMPAAGSLPHFLGIMFGRDTGMDLRAIIYRGSAAALADVVAGHVPMLFTTTSDMVEMHRAGRVRVLATSDQQPLAVSARCADLPRGRIRSGGNRLVRHVCASQDPARCRRASQRGDCRGRQGAGCARTDAGSGAAADRHFGRRTRANPAARLGILGARHQGFGLQAGAVGPAAAGFTALVRARPPGIRRWRISRRIKTPARAMSAGRRCRS